MNISNYLELCKPKVVLLMILTSIVGQLLAINARAIVSNINLMIFSNLGIAFICAAAAIINHLVDQSIDAKMQRTWNRPLPTGKVTKINAISLSVSLSILGFIILLKFTNNLTVCLTLITMFGYAVFYTVFLKRMTSQNIVIGGLAGACPPLLGCSAITGNIDPFALILVLIIFAWTPPHFWALAIYRLEDYTAAKIPMLPVTHGILFTKKSMLFYTILLFAVTLLPFAIYKSGWLYLFAAIFLNILFIHKVFKLYKNLDPKLDAKLAIQTFNFSIKYLGLLFLILLVDHYAFIF